MLWIQFKTAFRILKKQKLTAAINIAGLGLGLAFFALLITYVHDDLSFDRFHEKSDHLYILTSEFRDRFLGGVHHFIAGMLEKEFPEVQPGSTVRYARHSQTVRNNERLLVKEFAFTDPGFFEMFSFDLLEGSSSRIFSDPHQIILTSSTAQALFSGVDPLGQALSVRIGDAYQDFTVSGIIRDPPENSSLRFDGLLPYAQVFDAYQIDINNNDFVTLPFFTTTFLHLPDAEKAEALRAKLPAFNHRIYSAMWESVKMAPPKQGFELMRFVDYHRGDVAVSSFAPRGNPAFSWVLSGIALSILILACVNSITLSLAQCSRRFKEIGLRKVIGAKRRQLTGQLFMESFLTGFLSLLAGLLAAAVLLSPFNALIEKNITGRMLFHPQTLLLVLASVLAVSFFIGWIPALTLSRSPITDLFRGCVIGLGKSRRSLLLIIFQFTVSVFFIICSTVITRQLRYMTSKDLGYDPAGVILVPTQVPAERAAEAASILNYFKGELKRDPRVLAVSADSGTVGSGGGAMTRRYDKNGVEHKVEAFHIDFDYFRTLNVPLIAGREFSAERGLDSRDGIVVNEAFVRDFEIENPVGLRISEFAKDKLPPPYTTDPVIIGVVKDFHVASLHEPIGPMAFGLRGFVPIQELSHILVKISKGSEAEGLKLLETIWTRIRPDLPFRYAFLEEALAGEYRRERNWGRIVGWAAGSALLIAGMGLLGLTAVMVIRRTKETGIRKILGASGADILFHFSLDSLKWVLLSNLTAWPIAFLAARKWLGQFAYRIELNLGMFLLAALLSLILAGLIVSGQALRAVFSDPVVSLRHE